MKDNINNNQVHEKTSLLLRRTGEELYGKKIQIGIILYRLRRRSFGGILFFLAILSLLPGISMFSGAVMLVLAVQLLLGFKFPRLPRLVSEYALTMEQLKSIVNPVATKIALMEKYIKPRWFFLTVPPFTLMLGAIIFLLSLLIIIPLPFTNFLPALAILIISLGLLERDGLLIFIGASLSILSLILGIAVIEFAIKSAALIF